LSAYGYALSRPTQSGAAGTVVVEFCRAGSGATESGGEGLATMAQRSLWRGLRLPGRTVDGAYTGSVGAIEI